MFHPCFIRGQGPFFKEVSIVDPKIQEALDLIEEAQNLVAAAAQTAIQRQGHGR